MAAVLPAFILNLMLIVLVHVHVKPDCLEAFRIASLENARHSIQEPGISRFDVLQDNGDPNRFILNEVYHTDMMAEPRQGIKLTNHFPTDSEW